MSQPEIAKKFTKTPYFGSSRSFKVIDVNIPKKLVTSACTKFCQKILQTLGKMVYGKNPVSLTWAWNGTGT